MFDESTVDEEAWVPLVTPRTNLQKGDKLFITDKGGEHISCLSSLNDLLKYIIGYKDAADTLVTVMMEDDSYLDTFIFPTIYLYRHFVELYLKLLIRDGNELLDNPREGVLGFPADTHKLVDLWKKCKTILENTLLDNSMSDIAKQQTLEVMQAVEPLIEELHKVDPDSLTFRYPRNKQNKPLLPADWKYVNMLHVKEIMEKMEFFFSGVSDLIGEELKTKHVMELDSYE